MLRKFTLDDTQAVYDFSTNSHVTKYTGDAGEVKTLKDAQRVITNIWLKEYKEIGYARLALIEKQSSKVIGFCGLKYLPEFNLPDLGYRMLPEYWGKGYATESSLACLDYAKQELKLTQAIAMILPQNTSSYNVLRKLDFQACGETVYYGEKIKLFKKFI